MHNTLYLGNCRHYKALDEITNINDTIKSNCKKCVYFSSHNCGVPQIQNSVGEFFAGLL